MVTQVNAGVPEFVRLPEQASGQAAINALERAGAIEKVAKAHRLTVDELKKELLRDKSLTVDKRGHLFYIEKEVVVDTENAPAEAGGEPDAIIDPSQAFLLNSKPGSSKTIYLDFNGERISGTAWNSTLGQDPIDLAPYDLDGNPGDFNTTERNRIIAIWKRVAEDFAPFDVNVTTEYPGQEAISRSSLSDTVYGTNVVITRAIPVCNGTTDCGGVAYYGAFGSTSDYTKPALVFWDKLGTGNVKYTAEAISHEAGHNLDLRHDGTTTGDTYYKGHGSGATGWAPIMGVGYYKELTQWSKGEYPNANNTQDDYQAMANRGLVFRADDHGNSIATATFLNQGANFGTTGIIESATDKDFFSFNAGAGTLEVDVLTVPGVTNLDVLLKIYDPSGKEIAHANDPNLVTASVAVSLPVDGVYYLSVEGTGKQGSGSDYGYSDYGSLGQYTVVGTVTDPSGNTPPLALIQTSATSGYAPFTVQFDGSASEDSDGFIVAYSWVFGDGGTSASISPEYTFQKPGSYTVSLAVTDDGGLIDSETVEITVLDPPNQPPVAVAQASATSGKLPFTVNFVGSNSSDADGSITSYQWTFADGGSSTTANPSHTYTEVGTYVVTLTVTDNEGDSDSDSLTITVADDPLFIPEPSLTVEPSDSAAYLSWTSSGREDNFSLFRRSVSTSGKGKNKTTTYSSWTEIARVGATTVDYLDSSVGAGETYEYFVRATNTAGGQADSGTVSIAIKSSGGGGNKGGPKKK